MLLSRGGGGKYFSNRNVIMVTDTATALFLAKFPISSEESLGERVLRELYDEDAAACRNW